MATISQVQEVIFRLKLEDQASEAMKAAVEAMKNLNKEFDLNDDIVQKAGKGANTLINQNDAISRTAKTLTGLLRDLSSAQKALVADAATGGEKQAALTRTIENLTTKVQVATQAHNDAVKGVKASGDAHEEASNKVGLFGLSAQKTGFLVHDATKAIESLTLGMSPLQVAMQHVGQVQGIFGSLGEAAKAMAASFVSVPGAIIATGAALVGFGVIAESESRRMGDLRQQLRATHDDYASLATTVDAASKQIAATSSLSISQARTAAQTIGSAKLFSGTQADVVELTKTSQDLARVWNTDVATSAKFVADALNDPAKAAKDLAEKGFPGMSLELAHSIANMQTAGQSGQAFAAVMGVISKGTAGAVNDQSALSKALKGLEERLYSARDGGKSLASTIGGLVDDFAALQVRGLDKLIEGLDRFIQKVNEARQANRNAYPTGIDPETGAPIPSFPTVPSATLAAPKTQQDLTSYQFTGPFSASTPGEAARLVQPIADAAKQAFIEVWGPIAQQAGQKLGIAPSSMLGEWALETGWGRSMYGNNPGNIKAGSNWAGDRVVNPGDNTAYRAYPDPQAFLRDLVGVMQGARYDAVRGTGQDVNAYTTGLARAGYFTDPNGALKIANTIGSVRSLVPGIDTGGAIVPASPRNNDLATSQNAFTLAQGINPLSDQIAKSKAEIAGLDAGLKLATKGGDVEEIKRLTEALAAAKGKASDLITEQQKMARAAADAVNPLNAEAGATRDLAVIQQKYVEAARRAGTDIDVTSLLAEQTAHLQTLAVAFDDTVKATDRQAEANARISASVDQTAPSLIAATNREKALEEARKDFLPGPEQDAAVDRYTEALNRQSAAAADVVTAQKSFDQRDQLELIQAESDSLGENVDQRAKELAILKEKQVLLRSGADLQSAISQADLANVARIADGNAALNQQKSILSELSGFFESTFNTIANAITSAFATGNLAALKFKDIAKSVVSAVVSEFLKLAVLNPLRNWLEGGTNPTLSSVIGKLFGGSTSSGGSDVGSLTGGALAVDATAALFNAGSRSQTDATGEGGVGAGAAGGSGASVLGGSGGLLGGVSAVGAIAQGADKLGLLGGEGAGGIFTNIGSKVVNAITDAIGNSGEAIHIASQVAGAGEASSAQVLGASIADAVGASNGTAQVVSAAAGKVADALPYIGAAISVITDLIQGNYRGAGLVAGGAVVGGAIGSVIPVVGTAAGVAVGAIVGGLVDALFPAHPLHPFDASALNVQGGQLIRGRTETQAETPQAGAVVDKFATGINSFLDRAGVILTNLDGMVGAVGNGIQGLETFNSPEQLLSRLQFANNPSDTSNFGVAKGALVDMKFGTVADLQAEIIKIAGFADAASAIGVQLKAVGKDITNIQIAGVLGGNADAMGQVTNAQGQTVNYRNDLRTALNTGLQGQSFADTGALDAKINEINQFLNGTLPQLLTPIEQTSSQITDAVAKIDQTYRDAIQKSVQFGLDNTEVLTQAEAQAINIIRRVALTSLTQNFSSVVQRYLVAANDNAFTQRDLGLDALRTQQANEIEAFVKQWTDIFGDGVKSSDVFQASLRALTTTLDTEFSAKVNAANKAIMAAGQAVSDTFAGFLSRKMAAEGDAKGGELLTFDTKARQERDAFVQSWVNVYGELATQSDYFQGLLTQIDQLHGEERLAIVKKYAEGITGTLDNTMGQARGNVISLLGNLKDYAHSLQTGSESPLSPLSQYNLAASQFHAVAGAAQAGDYKSASQLQTYAESFRTSSRAFYGSGAQYATDVGSILDALSGVSSSTDALTLSAQQALVQQQLDAQNKTTDAVLGVADGVTALRAEMTAMRQELMGMRRTLALAA